VEFEAASEKINMTPHTGVSLHAVLKAVLGWPMITRLRVEGYAETGGDPATIQLRSERRAEAVVRWLVDRGLEPSRLHPVGCGARTAVGKSHAGRSEAGAVFRIEEIDHQPVEDCPVACAPSP
jgi:outer membrane protein OmpA-like peptidoglycan-associated protein